MTFVGKVLVGVQLVMSLCFLAFAGAVYTAQTNWRKNAEDSTAKLKTVENAARTKEAELGTELNNTKNALATQTARADSEESKATEFAGKNTTLEAQLAQLRTQGEGLQAQATVSAVESGARKEEATVRLKENKTLHESRDSLLAEKRQLEDARSQLEADQVRMQAKYDQLLEKLERHYQVARSLGIDLETTTVSAKDAPPPVVEGVVLETKPGARGITEFIEISIGSDDGLIKGHDLFVYRNSEQGKYLGKIRLVLVTADRAVGTVVEKARNGVIQKGDVVTSKL